MKRYLVLSLLSFAVVGCDAMTAHTDVVARAGEHTLTVDEAVELLTANPEIPAQDDVVASIADLWVDYTILARVAAEDSTMATLDLSPVVQPYVEQETFAQLRDQVVTADTILSDEELAEIYATEGAGTRVKARHILLSVPGEESDAADRDSVFALAEQLRERAADGEDFSALAREYSTDAGSAQQGGDLGWFERGAMVEPFEEAAFALQPGEVSGVVETPFGLHIIKVDDRETPTLEEMGDDFRQQVVSQRQQQSLDDYVESVRGPVELEVVDGATEVVRNLVEDPTSLQGRAASRSLVRWDGGSLTARELVGTLRRMPPQQRLQYASLDDEQLAEFLRSAATNELILADAAARGITVPETEQDSIRNVLQEQLAGLAQRTGLGSPPREGETRTEAVDRRVRALLTGMLTGQNQMLPLGNVSYALRDQMEWRVNERAFSDVVSQMEARRDTTAESADPAEASSADPAAGEPPALEPDTTG
ncbi:MAG: peptidylprolyl isomerase [Gemmatimonadota bacterium]